MFIVQIRPDSFGQRFPLINEKNNNKKHVKTAFERDRERERERERKCKAITVVYYNHYCFYIGHVCVSLVEHRGRIKDSLDRLSITLDIHV